MFRDVARCSLLHTDRRFIHVYYLHHQEGESFIALITSAVSTSETSVFISQTTRRNIPEDNSFQNRSIKVTNGRAVAQAVSHRSLNPEPRVRARVSPCRICKGESGNVTCFFSPSSLVFACQYQSIAATYSLVCYVGNEQWTWRRSQCHRNKPNPNVTWQRNVQHLYRSK
jgi:hypothetical protein